VPLQTTAPLTDFGYAGLITEPDSGLGLATYRAYDPRVGSWTSRDSIGETGSRAGNLYAYVDGNTLFGTDASGLSMAAALEQLGGGVPICRLTPKGAPLFISPNGMVMHFDLLPGQYLPGQGPHINLIPADGPNIHINLQP
jgi:RHS repeat-associated protein